ncbi:MAG: Pectate lyase superfamily protein [Syntrophorhabdus sp. PtaU1.Bin153]|nr:MAG: Pectate lyase superfamily protein [Syntrophorhabdus sp. PtaU1.Bin153]
MGTVNVFNVKDAAYGAHGNGSDDDTQHIQAAIDAASSSNGVVYFPDGVYPITRPLLLPANAAISLVGNSYASSIIRKDNRNKPVNPFNRFARNWTKSDSFDVDSFISLDHPDNCYADNCRIEHLTLQGNAVDEQNNPVNNMYALYGPRTSHFIVREVVTSRCDFGFYTRDSWLTLFEAVSCNECLTGLKWDSDDSGAGAGTSLTATRVAVVGKAGQPVIGFDIYALSYSTFNSCVCDHAKDAPSVAFQFELARGITLNSCGAENILGEVLKITYSAVTVNGFRTWAIDGPASGDHGYLWFEESSVVLNGCEFVDYDYDGNDHHGTSCNMIIQNNAYVTINECILPTKGNKWISYNNNCLVIHVDNNGVTAKTRVGDDERMGIVTNGKRLFWGSGAPTTGTWALGDIIYNSSPAAASYIGWVCVTAGAPGTWKAFGLISS